MMSVNADVEKLLTAWWEVPSKFLESWQGAVQEGFSPPWSRAYRRGIDAMETLTHSGLRAQAEWCKLVMGGMRSGSAETTTVGQWSAQLQSMVDAWSDMSEEMTRTWFQMMKEPRPFSWAGLPAGTSQSWFANATGLQMMQEIMRNSLKVQATWASILMPEMGAAEPGAGVQETGREKPDRKGAPRKPLEAEQAA